MIWVIGAANFLGYGVVVSDIRVTLANKTRMDLLKKAYPVGQYLIGGFAGSILIGFKLIESLKRNLALPAGMADHAWEPTFVAKKWAETAKANFDSAPEREKKLGSRLLLIGVSPTENLGVPEIPRVWIIRFSSPDFRPGFVRTGLGACHIGSGSRVAHYKSIVNEFVRFGSSLRVNMGGPDMWAWTLGHSIGRIVADNPIDGVSRHVHILVCRPGSIVEMKNNERIHRGDGSPPLEITMPPVATSYGTFLRQCREHNVDAAGAIA